MLRRALVICSIAAALGCSRTPRSVIVLDGWWNADYAKNSCRMANAWYKQPFTARLIAQFGCDAVTSCREMMPRVNACFFDDPTPEVRDFETELATAFAIDPLCHKMSLVRMTNPDEKDGHVVKALADTHWLLTLDFNPGSVKQSWKLLSPRQQLHVGVGDPKEIVHSICGVAGQHGGTFEN